MRQILIVILILTVFLPVSFPGAHAQELPAFEGQIAYVGADGNIWVLRGDGSMPVQVTRDATASRRYHAPRWSPDGARLAYCVTEQADESKGGLYISWTGEWLPFLIAQDVYCKDGSTGLFDWSLDGSKILYSRYFEYTGDAGVVWDPYYGIWEANIVSGAQTEAVPPPGGNPLISPDLSPDGRWVRFYELIYIEGLGVLRTWQTETGTLAGWLGTSTQLFPGLSNWSPDGSQIIFDQVTYAGFPGAGLFVTAPDGSDLRQVYSRADSAAYHPIWSPDGQNIVFVLSSFNRDAQGSARLALIDPQGENLRQVYTGPDSITPVVWSPSGSQLIFAFSEDSAINLLLYDLASDTNTILAAAGDWAADWSAIPQQAAPAASLPPDTLLDFPYTEGLLLYVSPDYRGVLANPDNGTEISLTRPMTVGGFTPSPSRRNLVFGNRWMSLDYRESGALSVHNITLPAAPDEGMVNWTADESRMALVAQDGSVWLVSQDGNAVQIPQATSLPEWSFNGAWLSYCADDGSLMVVGSASPPQKVADASTCQHHWSSANDSLAYTVKSQTGGVETLQSYIYDPLSGESKALMESTAVDSWSPDGKYLALKREDTQGNSYFAIEPTSGRQLFVGKFDERGLGNRGWMQTGSGYFFGPYRVGADLGSAAKVADILFDASSDGETLLIGIGEFNLITLACLRSNSGIETDLLTVNLAGLPEDGQPGISTRLSPDGEWVATLAYDPSGSVSRLDACDGGSEELLPPAKITVEDIFSGDSRWHVQSELGEDGVGELILRDLSGENDHSMPAMPASQAYWLKPLQTQPPENYLISGRVTSPDGTPLVGISVLLDDTPVAVTGEDGVYVIPGLAADKYTIKLQVEGIPFEPAQRKVSLPPDALDANFSVVPPPGSPTVSSPVGVPTQSSLSAKPTATPLYWPAGIQDVPGFLEGFLVANGLPEGSSFVLYGLCFGLVFLILIVFFILVRARKERPPRPAPEVVEIKPVPVVPAQTALGVQKSVAEMDTAPVKAADVGDTQPVGIPSKAVQESAQPEHLLRDGISQVKEGNYTQGVNNLRRVVRGEPDNAVAWLWLGWAAAQQRDLRAAESCFRRAQALGHPKANEGLRWIGRL